MPAYKTVTRRVGGFSRVAVLYNRRLAAFGGVELQVGG